MTAYSVVTHIGKHDQVMWSNFISYGGDPVKHPCMYSQGGDTPLVSGGDTPLVLCTSIFVHGSKYKSTVKLKYSPYSQQSRHYISLIKLIGQRSSKSVFSGKIYNRQSQNVGQNLTVDEDRSTWYSAVSPPCTQLKMLMFCWAVSFSAILCCSFSRQTTIL